MTIPAALLAVSQIDPWQITAVLVGLGTVLAIGTVLLVGLWIALKGVPPEHRPATIAALGTYFLAFVRKGGPPPPAH